MILFVPILTHLLLDRSYEGIGSFMGPQAETLGRSLWHNIVSKPLLKGELPFGMGEFKAGTTTKDLGQGKRVYRKRQLRLGPLDFTSMVWQRVAKKKADEETAGATTAEEGGKTRKSARTSSPKRAARAKKSASGGAKKTAAPRRAPRKKSEETAGAEKGLPAKKPRVRKGPAPDKSSP